MQSSEAGATITGAHVQKKSFSHSTDTSSIVYGDGLAEDMLTNRMNGRRTNTSVEKAREIGYLTRKNIDSYLQAMSK